MNRRNFLGYATGFSLGLAAIVARRLAIGVDRAVARGDRTALTLTDRHGDHVLEPVVIETLPGAENLGAVDDAEYFRRKMCSGMGVPRSYYGPDSYWKPTRPA